MSRYLRGHSRFNPCAKITPPLLILISGSTLTGKSSFGQFMKELICTSEDLEDEYHNNSSIFLLSTDSVLEVMRKYIRKEEDPVLHAPIYAIGENLNPKYRVKE